MAKSMLVFALAGFFIATPTFGLIGWPAGKSSDYDVGDSDSGETTVWTEKSNADADVCVPTPLGGVAWLLSQRQPDFGWKGETHRAVVAMALNEWGPATAEDRRQMELQLEVELTSVLLQNRTSPLDPTTVALYVHALIATRRNPHSFHGYDLVHQLEQMVHAQHPTMNPFLLLALCNANALTDLHVHMAHSALQRLKGSSNTESLSLALNAYECAGTRDHPVDEALIAEAREELVNRQQADGSFGNVYATAMVVQALASTRWSNKQKAVEYLKEQSTVDVNMMSTYLIQMALKAEKVNFIKDLHPDVKLGPVIVRSRKDDHFIQYTLRVGKRPDVYFTISIKVAPNATFFDVMKLSAQHDSKFNFSYHMDEDHKPKIYSISGVANDVEDNMFWRLCRQSDIDHNRHEYKMETIKESPITLVPHRDDHVLYWYKETDCEFS